MSKRKSTFAAVTAAALICAAATGCGSGSAKSGEKKDIKLGLALSTLDNPFFVEMKKGAEEEAKAQGAELNVQDAQNDASQQANQIQNFTSQNVKSIIVNPVDSDAAAPPVKAADKAGIPVVAVDRSVNKAKVATTVASDNVSGGKKAAQQLAKQLDEQGSILVLRGQPGTSASRERGKGFMSQIKKYPDIKVVGKQSANFDRAEGLDVTTNLMQSHPEATGIFAENDEMALGAIKALGAKAGKQVKVVGFDGTPDGFKAIEKGTLNTSIAQQPAELGKMAVRNAIRKVEGNDPDKEIMVPVVTVDKRNVSRYS